MARSNIGSFFAFCAKAVCACLLGAVLVIGGTNAYVVTSATPSITSAEQARLQETRDAIVVLGASVFTDGTPSDILRDRLETAAGLYASGIAPTIIVSGDGSTVYNNEPESMKNYLVNLGIPESAIVRDNSGLSTYESMYRARYVYGVQSVAVVTQNYHLPRAIASARLLGCSVVGVGADRGTYEDQMSYEIREIPARTKDLVQAALHMDPSRL